MCGVVIQREESFSTFTMEQLTLWTNRRDQARPYNFALSPVLVNLTGVQVTLLTPFDTANPSPNL